MNKYVEHAYWTRIILKLILDIFIYIHYIFMSVIIEE